MMMEEEAEELALTTLVDEVRKTKGESRTVDEEEDGAGEAEGRGVANISSVRTSSCASSFRVERRP